MIARKQQGQCFLCGVWVWTSDPNGILIPLPNLREGYLFCQDNKLAKVTACQECEAQLLGGEKLQECLEVFIRDFGGRGDLVSPLKYENSFDHWYKQGKWLPAPWLCADTTRAQEQLEQDWVHFKTEKYNDKNTPVYTPYMLGAHDFYKFLSDRLRGR